MTQIAKDLFYVGVNDHQVDLFEGQYIVPGGMAYNSYVLRGEKTAVLDTVSEGFEEEWLGKIEEVLGPDTPEYLVVHHMEPDHAANIDAFLDKYPSAQVVSSAQAFRIMKQFFGTDYPDRRIVVGEGSALDLGGHCLHFIAAPMVHWPEVLLSYESTDRALFSADGFGKFGALDYDDPEGWACEARRYYFGIVGKYGPQVQAVLKKASALDIQMICPLHGPVLTEDLGFYLDLYNTWSSYGVESEGVCIAYTSVYGNTKAAAELLAEKLRERGEEVAISDLARDDMPEIVEDAFRYGKLVLATTTYNADIFPFMRTFLDHLRERNYQKRCVAFIENGSWAPQAARVMKGMLQGCKELTFLEPVVTIRSAMTEENKAQLDSLAATLCAC